MDTGVYKIVNSFNSKIYVGSSSISLQKRFTKHIYKLSKNIHHNKHLQSSWNKYGSETFTFYIIEECSPENCIVREQFYIDSLKPSYNQNPTAGSCLGRKLSEETKKKISDSNRGKSRGNRGVKRSAEVIAKITLSKSKAKLQHYSNDEILLDTYISISDMARKLKVCRRSVAALIKGNIFAKGCLHRTTIKVKYETT